MKFNKITLATILFALNIVAINAQNEAWRNWAKTPPMGWNSYDSFGAAVYEKEVKSNADYMAKKLKNLGYEYVVVDYCWSYPHPPGSIQNNPPQYKLPMGGLVPWLGMDNYGRLFPDTRKFPSCNAAVGFKPLADYVHKLGLKFGIHVMRGVPRQAVWAKSPIAGTNGLDCSMIADTSSVCNWLNQMWGIDMAKKGAQEYLNSLMNLYASWGVDFVKIDDLDYSHDRPGDYHKAEVEGYRKAIDQCGRPIVFSMSPRINDKEGMGHVEKFSNMWRISDDFWDKWERVREMFPLMEKWNSARPTGSYPDADMIPFGLLRRRGPIGVEETSRFTPDEHYTLMSFWCLAKSPLMLGGDLPMNDAFTEKIIMNKAVLQVNKEGKNPRPLTKTADWTIWISDAPDGGIYMGIFNISDAEMTIPVPLSSLNMGSKFNITDLWEGTNLANINEFKMMVKPHGAQLIKIKKP
jgi:alpha-galactosidase